MDPNANDVLRLSTCEREALTALLEQYGMLLETVANGAAIEGSYWGDEEAGLLNNRLIARVDTPLHSILHEACHYICMDSYRRQALDTNAGGGYDEENAVCYLQILLATELPGIGRERMYKDMDAWGYTFRLGSAQAWFEHDADDARQWLIHHDIVTPTDQPTFRLRKE